MDPLARASLVAAAATACCLAGRPDAIAGLLALGMMAAGFAAKRGDDLLDVTRAKWRGGALIAASLALLALASANNAELYWMIGGGLVGALAAKKFNHRPMQIALVGYALAWLLLLRSRHNWPNPLVPLAPLIATWLDEIIHDNVDPSVFASRTSARVLRWVAEKRYMLTVATLALFLGHLISPVSLAAVMAFELGYSLAEALPMNLRRAALGSRSPG